MQRCRAGHGSPHGPSWKAGASDAKRNLSFAADRRCHDAGDAGGWDAGAAILGTTAPPGRRSSSSCTRVTDSGGPDYVRPADRIATFDNDGTLWPENPVPFEVAFIFDQIKRDAVRHTDWKDRQPYKSVLEDDLHELIAQGRDAVAQLFMATHAGMTAEAFDQTVRDWIAVAKHPRFNRRYAELGYQPMLELLAYLRANGFKTFIVSGGGVRVYARVRRAALWHPTRAGDRHAVQDEVRNAQRRCPALSILPELDLIGTIATGQAASAIHQIIGRRPIAAFGNSDGDQQMMQLTDDRPQAELRPDRASHRRWARIRLRQPSEEHRQAGRRAGRRAIARMDHRRHEARLEAGVRVRGVAVRLSIIER